VDFLIFDWGKCNYPLYIYSDIYLSFFFYIKKTYSMFINVF
jgi:hypothetical protein